MKQGVGLLPGVQNPHATSLHISNIASDKDEVVVHRGCGYEAVGFGQRPHWGKRPPDFRDLLGNWEDFVLEVLLDPPEPAFGFSCEQRIC